MTTPAEKAGIDAFIDGAIYGTLQRLDDRLAQLARQPQAEAGASAIRAARAELATIQADFAFKYREPV